MMTTRSVGGFPLAIPLIAGPGSICVVIPADGEKPASKGWRPWVAITFGRLALSWGSHAASRYLENALGKVGNQT